MIDWLHTVDQGIGQDALGHLFYEALQKFPGDNQQARLRALWGRIRLYYQNTPVSSKLDSLTLEMVKKQGQAAKLSSKAAEARGLYRFGLELARELAGPADEHRRTIVSLFTFLNKIVASVEAEPLDIEAAVVASRKFSFLWRGSPFQRGTSSAGG